MTSNIAIARGALDNIPPIALASSRWFLVFLVFLPFVYSTLIKKKKFIKKTKPTHKVKVLKTKIYKSNSFLPFSSEIEILKKKKIMLCLKKING